MHDDKMSVEDKIKAATERGERHINLCKMFADQISDTTFDKEGMKGDKGEEVIDPELSGCIQAMHTFFVKKCTNTQETLYQFQSRVSAKSLDKFDLENAHLKTYSGRFNGQPEKQAEYALTKFRTYLQFQQFLEFFPIDPPALNPIIVATIMANLEPIIASYKKYLSESKRFIMEQKFSAIDIMTNAVNLKKEDTLQYYINTRVEKWKSRLDQKQKRKFFLAGHSLTDSVSILDKSSAGQLALTWSDQK